MDIRWRAGKDRYTFTVDRHDEMEMVTRFYAGTAKEKIRSTLLKRMAHRPLGDEGALAASGQDGLRRTYRRDGTGVQHATRKRKAPTGCRSPSAHARRRRLGEAATGTGKTRQRNELR